MRALCRSGPDRGEIWPVMGDSEEYGVPMQMWRLAGSTAPQGVQTYLFRESCSSQPDSTGRARTAEPLRFDITASVGHLSRQRGDHSSAVRRKLLAGRSRRLAPTLPSDGDLASVCLTSTIVTSLISDLASGRSGVTYASRTPA